MRDVDPINERIACDWWHPQSYKKNKYIYMENDHKEGERGNKNYVHEIPFVNVTVIQQ